jgi:hypothetical protein
MFYAMLVATEKIALTGDTFASGQMDATMHAAHHFFERLG